MKGLVLLLAAVALGNPVNDVLVMPSGEICVLRSSEPNLDISNNELLVLSSSGNVLWLNETPDVRAGCTGGVLSISAEGNIICACEEGTGYTDVYIGVYSPSGETLSTDIISGECYDSPQDIRTVEGGTLLAWDSWSEERGIHVAFLAEDGAVRDTEFITGTMHPMNIAMDHRSGVTVLGVSPVATEEDVLFGMSEEGSVLWSSSYYPEGAMIIHDISVEESGEFTVLWGEVTVGIDGSSLLITRHSAGGAVTALETKPFESIEEISAVNLIQGRKALVVSNSIRLLETDLDGAILTEVELQPCYAYSHVIPWETKGYIFFGPDGLEVITGDGQQMFRI